MQRILNDVSTGNEPSNLDGGLGTRVPWFLAPMRLVQAVGSTTRVFVLLIWRGIAFRSRGSVATAGDEEERYSAPGCGRRGLISR